MGKKVIAICYSDLHIDNWNRFNERGRRLKNGLDVIRQIKKQAKIHKCPILFLGDLVHKEKHMSNHILAESLPFFKKMWTAKGPQTYAISGNHDQSEENTHKHISPSYIKTFSQIFPGLHCVDYGKVSCKDFDFYGVPYLSQDIGFKEVIESFKVDSSRLNILGIHTTIPGAHDTDGREINTTLNGIDLKKLFKPFDLVLVGHIHKYETFKFGKTKVIQIGAPQQQRFTDRDNEMGYIKLYEDLTHELVPMNYPKFFPLKPGEKAPDNKNFYVVQYEKPTKEEGKRDRVFDINISKSKLASMYIKEKRIKDKDKETALIEALKNAE